MIKLRIAVVLLLLNVSNVECFGVNDGSHRRVEDILAASRVPLANNPGTSAFRRSKATTALRYRNNPHETATDYYAILGVPRTANDAEIKRGYRNRAKQFHPGTYSEAHTADTYMTVCFTFYNTLTSYLLK